VSTPSRGAPLPPAEFELGLDPSVRRPRPEIIVGGRPVRVLRLRPAGARQVDAWDRGEPIGPGRGARALARRLLDAGIAHPRPPDGAGPTTAEVTVVIPVRDRSDGLAETLAALGPVGAVIVVDDGSEIPVTVDGATVMRHDIPKGPAAARNAGWRAATTPLVAFVDADCVPTAGWLTRLLPHFADEAVGAVAPRIITRRVPETPPALAAYEQRRSPLDLGTAEAPVRPGSSVPYVPTAALVVRRRAMAEAGDFDETLRYGEDVDLVWRLDQMGWRVRYQPSATVAHPPRPDLGSWARQRYEYGRSASRLAARHGRAVAPAAMNPWTAAAWGLATFGCPVAGAGVVAVSTAALARRAGRDRATARALAGLAFAGNIRAGAGLATAVRRAWLPPAAAAAWVSARHLGAPAPALALGAALVVPPLAEWASGRPDGFGPLKWSVLRLADDLAYQTGVWAGVIETRSAAALLPDLR
jgi:mycofactocin system glycosyltransferase